MTGSAKQAVERYLSLSGLKESTLKRAATPCIDDHQLQPEDFVNKGELSEHASKCVLKCLHQARLQRPDIMWAVNSLAREVSKWTIACDKRLRRLISYLHHASNFMLTCWVGDAAKDIHLAIFCDASFAGDLRDSKSTSGEFVALIGPHTFVPLAWFTKKQGAA